MQTENRTTTSSESPLTKIKKALTDAATLRGGTLTRDSLQLFSSRLAKEHTPDVLAVLGKLGETARAEYESAIPEMGALLRLIEAESIARQNRSAAAKSERLVRWQCPTCKATLSGFPRSTDDLFRKCRSLIRFDERGNRVECQAEMTVVQDEAQESAGEMVPYRMPEWLTRSGAR